MSEEDSEHQPLIRTSDINRMESGVASTHPDPMGSSSKKQEPPPRQRLDKDKLVLVWGFGLIISVVLCVLGLTVLKNVCAGDVPLRAYFNWLVISWASLLFSWVFSLAVARLWYDMSQKHNFEDYQNVLYYLQTPVRALIRYLSFWLSAKSNFSDHGNCTSTGFAAHNLQSFLLFLLVVQVITVFQYFVIQMLFAKTTVEYLNPRKQRLERSLKALKVLLWDRKSSSSYQRLFIKAFIEDVKFVEHPEARDECSLYDSLLLHDNLRKTMQNIVNGEGEESIYQRLQNTIIHNFRPDRSEDDYAGISLEASEIEDQIEQYCLRVSEIKEQAEEFYHLNRKKLYKNEPTRSELLELLVYDDSSHVSYIELGILVTDVGECSKEVRKGIENSKNMVRRLNQIISVFVFLAVCLIFAAFTIEHFENYLVLLWTMFTGISFALSGTVQEFLKSCAFVFAKHPYDVGDCVVLRSRQLIVLDIDLSHTTFRDINNGKVTLIPHSVASEEIIENTSRSEDLKENFAVAIKSDDLSKLTSEKLQQIMNHLNRFVKDNHLYIEKVTVCLGPGPSGDPEKNFVNLRIHQKKRLVGSGEGVVAEHCDKLKMEFQKMLRQIFNDEKRKAADFQIAGKS